MTRGMGLLDSLLEDDPRADWNHICLPSMGYVCGGSIVGLADGGPGGHQLLGASNVEQFAKVTCPDCRAPGRREVARIAHRQREQPTHECTDSCRWTEIPEEDA